MHLCVQGLDEGLSRKKLRKRMHDFLDFFTGMTTAAVAAKLPEPARMGPQVLRNTVLVQWLESGCSVSEVLARSGMKNPNALQHLRAYFNNDKDL